MSGPSLTVYPEHVSFCFLITAVVSPPPPENGWGVGFDGPAAQRLLALFLLDEIQDISSPTLSTLPCLLQRLQQQLGMAGAALATVLLACLQSLQTPDDLISLAARFSGFLAPPGSTGGEATDVNSIAYVATSSPMGMFLRRVRLGLTNMSLQGLAALAADIQEQVNAALPLLQQQQQQQHAEDDPTTQPTGPSSSTSSSPALKEPAVLDAYLNTLLAAVKSLGPCLPAATIQAAAAPLSDLQGSVSKLQYLDLAVSLAHKDMSTALSALHQYFDRNGSSSGTQPGSGPAGPGMLPFSSGSSNKGKGQHQSALHNLASLQASLGHPQEALAALQELLRLGQQQGDEWSLLHGLASLCRLIGVSEGLQGQAGAQPNRATAGRSRSHSSTASSWAGWGLLDLRRTEQQLQLQALLQRCLDAARDMRVPHIAAYAAVALSRFRLMHASSSSGSLEAVTAVPGLSNDSTAAAASAAAACTSLAVQRMLLDVATLEHQAATAAAAPGTPAVAATAVAAGMAQGQAAGVGLATRPSELYNHTDAFGMGSSTAAVALGAMSSMRGAVPAAGTGWRSSSAAVSQALATGNVVAATALQLQGAPVLAGVRCLMVLNGPGGAGIHDAAIAAAIPAAAAAAAAGFATSKAAAQAGSSGAAAAAAAAVEAAAAAAASASPCIPAGGGASVAAFTGSNVSCDDVAAAWVQLVQVALELQGIAGAQHVLSLAEAHFPRQAPQQLLVAREVIRLKSVLQCGDYAGARLACDELQGLAPAAPQLGVELQLVAAEAHVQLLQASGCFAEAHAAAAALFATAAGAGMQPQAVSALLLMAKACLAAGDAAGGLPHALSALLHCQLLQLDSLLPDAVLQVGTAWQALVPDAAAFVHGLLQQVLPLAHAEGRLRVRGALENGIARLALAQAQANATGHANAITTVSEVRRFQGSSGVVEVAGVGVGDAVVSGRLQLSGSDLQEEVCQRLRSAAIMLQQAGEVKSAGSCWLLLAHVCNAAGLEQDRNEAAANWHACKQRSTAATSNQL